MSNVRLSQIEAVEMYSKPNCPYCVRAKEFLSKRDIPFDEYLVGNAVMKRDIQNRVDGMGLSVQIRTVPQIFAQVGNEWHYIGGYDELSQVRP
jgi:glutaredoxin